MKQYLPNPVNELMKASYTGQLSRRDVMKRGGALGLSATMMGTILASHNAAAQDASPEASPAAAQPAGWSIVVPEGLPDLAGATISAMLEPDGPLAAFDQASCDMFAEATGATVNYIMGPPTDRLVVMQQTMAAESSDIDVAMIDVIWPGIFAAHAVDLSDQVGEVEFFERIQENNTVDGMLVGLPYFTDAGLLYYRTDLLEKYGFEGPPTTWQELTDMATTIVEGEAAANTAFTGFTFQGGAYEGLTCNALEWQYSNGGGSIIEPDGTVSMNNDQAKAALELAASWVGTISPEAVTGYMEEDARAVWQGGNAAFMRNWPYAYSLSAASDSVIRDVFAITQLPMGDGEGATHAATLGGWQMFVSRYSENQDAAKAFAKYMVSPELQKARAIERAALPTIGSLYEDADILAANPYFETLFDVFESGSVARPSTPTADLYGEASLEYFSAVSEILTGSAEVDSRVEDLAASLEDIMADV